MDAEKSPDVDAKDKTSVIKEQQPIDSEKKRGVSSEERDLSLEMKPMEKQSSITILEASVHKYENDWFDKLLDFFAAIVGGVSKIVGLSFFIIGLFDEKFNILSILL